MVLVCVPNNIASEVWGSPGMRERVMALDGTLKITSAPMMGTTIEGSVATKEVAMRMRLHGSWLKAEAGCTCIEKHLFSERGRKPSFSLRVDSKSGVEPAWRGFRNDG